MKLYDTVRKEAVASQIIEKSRFIVHVCPVNSREEAETYIADIRNKYRDATHNVPAMVIGDKSQIQWGSDDGEPQGTSGAPIVQLLVKQGLTNLVVVVTRYFGGIKLGTGGLVRAYTSSARMGIEAAGICGCYEVCNMKMAIDYPFLAKLQNMAVPAISEDGETASGFVITDTEYSDRVIMTVSMSPESVESVKQLFANITSGDADLIEIGEGIERL